DAGAEDDRGPDPRPARRLRLRAHGCVVDPRHGLAHGLVVRRAGGVRQSLDGLPDRRGSTRPAAADGLSGRVLRLAHHERLRAPGLRAGEGITPPVHTYLVARSAPSGLAPTADRAGAGTGPAVRAGPCAG